jgi:hypothetical protein
MEGTMPTTIRKALTITTSASLLGLLLVSANSQEPEMELQSYSVFTEAYQCDWSRHAEADDIFKKLLQPAFESALRDGVILGWSYMRRALGDEWGRMITVRFETGRDIFKIRADLRSRVVTDQANELNEFFEICGPHRENIYRATGYP